MGAWKKKPNCPQKAKKKQDQFAKIIPKIIHTLHQPSTTTTIATTDIGSSISGYAGAVCRRTRIATDIHLIVTKVHNCVCTIKKAMLFAGFTAEVSNRKSLQRRVIRFIEKLTTGPPQLIKVTPDAAAGDTEKISGLTTSKNGSGSNNNGVTPVLGSKNGSNNRTIDSTGSNTTTITLKPSWKTAKQVHVEMVHEQIDKIVKDEAYKVSFPK